ncbi:MAG: MFS transporter [Phycisphaeraceae bacterium]|nr:MFS transporter [Phycisphaeraceae bacterium]
MTSGGPSAARAAKVSLALLLLINLFNYIDRYILAAVLPLIGEEVLPKGDPNSDAKLGLLTTAFLVSYMVTAPVFGWLGDRVPRWGLVGVGVILWSLASGASGLVVEIDRSLAAAGYGVLSAYTALLITRMFIGIGEGAYGPVAPALISDLFPVERRGMVMAWFYMAIPVGSAVGFALGGYIGSHFGWRWAFYAVVPPGVLLGIWCFLRPEPPRGAADPVGQVKRRMSIADVLVLARTPSYVLNVAGMTLMTFALGGVAAWMPYYVVTFRKAASLPDATMTFGAITVVAGLIATLSGGWIADRLQTRIPGAYLLVSGFAMLLGFPLFLAVLVTPFPWCWGVIFAALLCLFFNTGPSNTAIANVVHPGLRATAFAICIFVIHALGDAISPPLIGFVSDRTGNNMNAGFALVSVAVLGSAVCWLWGSRHLARDRARLDSPIPLTPPGGGFQGPAVP